MKAKINGIDIEMTVAEWLELNSGKNAKVKKEKVNVESALGTVKIDKDFAENVENVRLTLAEAHKCVDIARAWKAASKEERLEMLEGYKGSPFAFGKSGRSGFATPAVAAFIRKIA